MHNPTPALTAPKFSEATHEQLSREGWMLDDNGRSVSTKLLLIKHLYKWYGVSIKYAAKRSQVSLASMLQQYRIDAGRHNQERGSANMENGATVRRNFDRGGAK